MSGLTFNSALRGAAIGIRVLGCRSSLCDGEILAGDFEARGAVVSQDFTGVRAAVIVTCSVTAEADRKCRQLIRRARHQTGESGVVAVCGCWAQGVDADTARDLGVDILAGSRQKSLIADAVEKALCGGRSFVDLRASLKNNLNAKWEELPLPDRPVFHTRAFVKIQDGCDRFCTYCIIPFLRGRPVSRPQKNILEEVRRLTEKGCREVVLTGIHLGMYGRDVNGSLAELVRGLSKIEGLKRLRMGSLEPFSLTEDLLDAMAESPVFCPHLHLPVQSGSDGVLARMRRGHTAGDFIRICGAAREKLGDDLHISSDILTGFPGETDADFQATLDLMRQAEPGRVHVFPFSGRPGTVAERLPDQVEPQVRAERAAEAAALGKKLLSRYARRFIDRELEVLMEQQTGRTGQGGTGHTPHFLEAVWEQNKDLTLTDQPGEIVRLKILSESNGRLEGLRPRQWETKSEIK